MSFTFFDGGRFDGTCKTSERAGPGGTADSREAAELVEATLREAVETRRGAGVWAAVDSWDGCSARSPAPSDAPSLWAEGLGDSHVQEGCRKWRDPSLDEPPDLSEKVLVRRGRD